jgi:hypothetical protein
MWPLEDHFADKIAAMYERRGPDKRHSSRVKDLVDLDLIAIKSPVSGPVTHSALRAEVRRRQDFGIYLVLPSVFDVPDRASWTSAITSKLPEPGIFRSSTEPRRRHEDRGCIHHPASAQHSTGGRMESCGRRMEVGLLEHQPRTRSS